MGWLLRNRNAHKHTFGQGVNLLLRVFQRRAPDVVNVPSHTVHALGSLWRRADIVHNPKDERFPLQNKIRFTRWCLLSRLGQVRSQAYTAMSLSAHWGPLLPPNVQPLCSAWSYCSLSCLFVLSPTPPLLWSRLKLYSLISPVYSWFSLSLVLPQFKIIDLRIQVLTEVLFLQIHFQEHNCFISRVLISLKFQVCISSLILIPVLLGSLLNNLRPERHGPLS